MVEILDDAYLKERKFIIDGEEWTVDKAWKDMTNKTPDKYVYMRDANKFIKPEHILDIPMGKLNKEWIELIQKEGYTIIDIGYPQGLTTESAFYNMEIRTIKW
ncbi:MAG: hypothetical protein RL662_644 [Bacteroidota bacterium]|jgi:hypothetical protein